MTTRPGAGNFARGPARHKERPMHCVLTHRLGCDCFYWPAPHRAATRGRLLCPGRKHVVVHADYHRDEDDRVVKEMYLSPKLRKHQLQETDWDRRAKPVVLRNGLPLQNCMLDVMPKLDHERDGPPFTRSPGETFPEHPKSNEHHDGIAVVQQLGSHEPGKEQSKNTVGTWPRPAEHVNLKRLSQVLSPVGQHYEHEHIEGAFVPNAIQLLVDGEVAGGSDPCLGCSY